MYANETADGANGVIDIEDEVEFYLDAYGEIYHYEILTSGDPDTYGIVLRSQNGVITAGGLNDATDLVVELYLEDGTVDEFTVNTKAYDNALDDLYGDGIIVDANAGAVAGGDAINWVAAAGDIVKYKLNDKGEITAMEWIVDTVGGTTGVFVAPDEDMTKKGYFNGYEVASDAIIFTYTAGFGVDEDNYGTATRAGLLDTELTNAFYKLGTNNKITVLYIDSATTTTKDVYGVILKTAKVAAKAPMYEVKMLVDGEEVTYRIDANVTAYAKLNTLYMLEFNADGTTLNDLIDVDVTPEYEYIAVLNLISDPASYCDVSGYVVKSYDSGDALQNFLEEDDAGAPAAGPAPRSAITLANDVIVYVIDDTAQKLGSKADIDGATLVKFYDFDGDMVYDIVIVNE